MATLATKYGPSAKESGGDAAAAGRIAAGRIAAGRLEAYARVTRAALEARDGPLVAPVLRLSDDQLGGLFAPRQLAALVGPLDRPSPECGS
jgi:hypothetical protein